MIYFKNECEKLYLDSDIKYERYSIKIIEKHYSDWVTDKTASHFNLTNKCALTGIRRIGKTTILKQLYNKYSDACYLDCTDISESESIIDIFDEIRTKNVKLLLIDELCKLHSDDGKGINRFISIAKGISSDLFIIFTGSVKAVISNIASDISNCYEFDMQPLTYMEFLLLKGNDFELLQEVSSIALFDEYLSINMFNDNNRYNLIEGSISDTYESARASYAYSNNPVLDIKDKATINKLFLYVELCQIVFRSIRYFDDNGNPVFSDFNTPDSPYITDKNVFKSIVRYIESLRNSLKSIDINNFCKFLVDIGLAISVNHYSEFTKLIKSYKVPYFIFLLPQAVFSKYEDLIINNDYYTPALNLDINSIVYNGLKPLWVENLLAISVYRLYDSTGKFRNINGREVDILYSVNKLCGIEVKTTGMKRIYKFINIVDEYFSKLTTSYNNEKFNEFIITNEDKTIYNPVIMNAFEKCAIVRNDLILLIMEMEYFNIKINSKKLNNLSVIELLKKYGIFNIETSEDKTNNIENTTSLFDN